MKIIISPAKSLNFETESPINEYSQPVFLSQAERLNKILKKKSARTLSKLMSISDNLGRLNYERNQEWNLPFTQENAKQAIFAFTGEVYRGIDVNTIPVDKLPQLQNKLRILSGQYGLLKPLDLIQAYRLEMSTKLKIGVKSNLYQFWGNTITDELNKELGDDELFINLASNEYFKVLKPKELKVPVITPVFKDFKNGQYKTIMTFAKLARGQMVRYIIENDVNSIGDLKGFNTGGYGFDANLSSENELVFTR
jgi:cytoplasmic iron level regulating protein YaaA (DUF328/UPF0246 family)